MERVVASRMPAEFAQVAQQEGEVIEKTEEHIAVRYKDGTVHRVPLGVLFTTAEGTLYPNTVVTQLNVGDKVSKDDVISYNSGFFKPSVFDKRRVDYLTGCLGRVALREASYTVEDSSSISEAFARRMTSTVAKTKVISVRFDQTVTGLVKVGDSVDLNTILCTIEDQVASDVGLYDETTRETLRRWSAMTPTAKVVGKVERIEVYYNGDFEEMSESLQEITAASERVRRRIAKRLNEHFAPAEVSRNVRFEGNHVEEGTAIIVIYFSTPVAMGIGDKLVVANQLKSTVGEVLFGDNRTIEGEPIDLIFGAKSAIDRVVLNPFVTGSTNTVLRYIGETAYEMMFGDSK